MTAYRPVLASLAGLVLSFVACFILLVIAPLLQTNTPHLTSFDSM